MVCPPATLVAALAAALAGTAVAVGGQDCHMAAKGAHTGDIAAPMLADAGARFVILGHSERRGAYRETDPTVRAKAEAAIAAGLTPIVCVGEPEDDRLLGRAEEVVAAQVAASLPAGFGAAGGVVAYEPVWAIGTGRTPTEADIAAMHAMIRARLVAAFPARGGHAAHPVWRVGEAGQRRRHPGPAQCGRGAGGRGVPGGGGFPGHRGGGGVAPGACLR